ncbi:phosphatidylserine decarboxylase-domain-containing protein [Hypoxylon trugodes]|uniref:phosphatidylserine decarboxylase-domain-containing protein n=1 Tax=Hypoxylon trugodes TaxID=326681 RepID=UPI00218DC5C6|nr:phosphatidylserine decarboxylase-domain-containing protein [Hypoxylon trugodes]KAI1389400.1 phosphatidylserine decarboxylase-domain-containing protein [Hypoxylon trugodes]
MVRIIPNRLKNKTASSATNSSCNSRSTSPMPAKLDTNISDGRKDSGLVLKIVVIRARNLAAKDRGGTSDPYLQLTCGESKFVTHHVPKTLNPDWNVICTVPITGVDNLLLDCICWDKDRFSKDYLGEFDLALEEIFANEKTEQEPTWYPLKSKKRGKKSNNVSGEVLLQCTLFDSTNKDATDAQILEKLRLLATALPEAASRNATPSTTPMLGPTSIPKAGSTASPQLSRNTTDGSQEDEDEDEILDDDETPEDEDPNKPENAEKRKRRLRIKGLKRKRRQNPYEFVNGGSDVVGLIFLEICKITDLPPESNLTRTSFDMDPFVVASLGKKTYRTRVVRHNLNPVFNEKMLFHVLGHERSYSFAFTVIDRDKYSGNDFIASTSFPVQELIERSPKANPETGLYDLKEPAEFVPAPKKRLARLGMSRSSSSQSLGKGRPALPKNPSGASTLSQVDGQAEPKVAPTSAPNPALLQPDQVPNLNSGNGNGNGNGNGEGNEFDDSDFTVFTIPLKMKNLEKWEAKHSPMLTVRAKYMPYPALRQQFWRAMLRQYDADESGEISKVELTTMLDTLGSTLRESTIDSFFQRFPHKAASGEQELTMDEAVICLEDQLDAKNRTPAVTDKLKNMLPDSEKVKNLLNPSAQSGSITPSEEGSFTLSAEDSSVQGQQSGTSTIIVPDLNTPGEEGEALEKDDLNVDRGEEHVVEIRECPICHQPRLNKRKDADIITHIATCASQDWRQVNSLMMGGFVTASQAQRKWYSKVITKISYGGYKLGANSANILVQDRLTGQINEEKMSVYVRLGIRLLYKGLKSKDMENKRIRKLLKSLSIKQGKKYDDPTSKSEILPFIEFHQLDMSEVLRPVEEFKNFNEFFYRALKPNARPCSAPDDSRIIVSPADCRSVVFNTLDSATSIWVKGREFSIKRLLGDAYPEDVKRYENGALGIFRLAPQDYHRFHIPVDGILRKPKLIAGEYYTVNPMAIRSALDVYGENVRVLCPIDTELFGRVMVVCVGAMMVGSTVITRNEGDEVKRAEELGYFKFGGSTIVTLFEPGKMVFDDDLVDNSTSALETLIRAGMSVGHSPQVPQFTPDMRKDEKEVTEAEKAEAHRRIRGGVETPDEAPLP